MSELRDIIAATISERQIGTGENCRNLATGRRFVGEYEEIQDIELNTEIGRDARESALLHVLDRAAAAEINQTDEIEIILFGIAAQFAVVRRKDNPGDPQVEFGLMKLTPQDT